MLSEIRRGEGGIRRTTAERMLTNTISPRDGEL
jgi:hypothetical protein